MVIEIAMHRLGTSTGIHEGAAIGQSVQVTRNAARAGRIVHPHAIILGELGTGVVYESWINCDL